MADYSDVRCNACESSGCYRYLSKFDRTMYRCRNCGLVFTFPVPNLGEVEGRYSEEWFVKEYLPSYGIDPANPNLNHLNARYDHELVPLEPYRKLNRLLDVGAGVGLLLSQAKKRGWNVEGVELSEFGPRYAQEKFGIEIQRGTLQSVKFPDAHFDAVILQDTIEHVPNPAQTMERIGAMLRPGGVVSISTPNFGSLGRRIAGRDWALISPSEHLSLFTIKALRTVLARKGFRAATLNTSPTLNGGLIHTGEAGGSARPALLRWTAKRLQGRDLSRLNLGDEIFCYAVKL